VRGVLGSYRWRRRFAWIGGALAVTAGILVAIFALPDSNGRHYNLEPTGTEPVQTEQQFIKQVHLTAADKRDVNSTLVPFVRTGVTRADPAAAWALATPAMHSAVTHKEWNSGKLPVLPFPAKIADQPTWNVLTSFPNDVTIDLLLQPKRGSNRGPIAFAVELKKKKAGAPWLVDSMIPEQGFEASPTPAKSGGKTKSAGAQEQQPAVSSRSGNNWLYVVPGALLALIVLVPAFVLTNNWRKHRAIERRYRAERGL
jgi:hypothetical protein